jgi:hypothetical protein
VFHQGYRIAVHQDNHYNKTLIDAWKHVVTIFRNTGVSNVKWVWTTNATNSGSATYTGWFPGDDWVDMVSIDGYNWGTTQSWSSWQTFAELLNPSYKALSISSKPLLITEFSSTEHGDSKAQWTTDMFKDIPEKFPRIFALMWFNQSKSAEADWAVSTSDAALKAWNDGIAKIGSVGTRKDVLMQKKNSSSFIKSIMIKPPSQYRYLYNLHGIPVVNNSKKSIPAGIYINSLGTAHYE